MSQAAPARFLANDAYVTALAYAHGVAAFALGDGMVKLVADDGGEVVAAAHDGAALCLAAYGDGFVSGGDDGRLVTIARDGAVTELLKLRGRMIEHVAVSPVSGALVAAAGRDIYIVPKPGAAVSEPLTHKSSVTGLAFDPRGKRIACSHYNGVSLWWLASETATLLDWKGSHIGVWWHPNGEFVMTAMQENALHGWRLADKQHMRMAGYPAKTKSMAWFSKGGKWLATAGSEAVICWPFDGKGPMGKSAREIGPQGSICTVVAPHPSRDLIASGHADGSVWLTRFEDDKAACIRAPAAEGVSALVWRADGGRLAFGCEDGAAGVLNFEAAAV